MDELQKYLDAIRENGDLRKAEARKLTERLGSIFDRIGDALLDAGIWGTGLAYKIDEYRKKGAPVTTKRFIRPTKTRLSLADRMDADRKDVVVTEVLDVKYSANHRSLKHAIEGQSEKVGTITARPVESEVSRYRVDFDAHGSFEKVQTHGVQTAFPGANDEEEMQKLVERIPDQEKPVEHWTPKKFSSRSVSQPRDKAGTKLILKSRDREVPFVPRKVAVKVAEELPSIMGHFAGYVEELAVETEEARKSTQALSVTVS